MKNNELNYVGIIFGIAGIGYALYTSYKMNKLCEKIDTTVDNISKDICVDIPDAIIKRSVDKAVDDEVAYQVEQTTIKAVKEIKMDIHDQVKTAVEAEHADIRKEVSDKVAQEVANIDMDALKRDVTVKAKRMIVEKFDGSLDGLLGDFNQNLNNMTKIYKSIANSITGSNEKGTVLRIS